MLPQTVDLGSGIIVDKISQSDSKTRYFYRDTTREVELLVRHSRRAPAKGAKAGQEQHNVFITNRTYGIAEDGCEACPDTITTSSFTVAHDRQNVAGATSVTWYTRLALGDVAFNAALLNHIA